MSHHHPYPSDPPLAAFQDAYRIIKAGRYSEELRDLAADIWTIQGYLQKLLIGDHSQPFNGPPPVVDSTTGNARSATPLGAEVQQAAQQLLLAIDERPVVAQAGSDLSLLLTLLLPLLQKLLERLLNS